ncbi:S1 family peptidase, partial [Crocosphaera watsonii]
MNRPLLIGIILGTIATIPIVQTVASRLTGTEISDQAKLFIVQINGQEWMSKGKGTGTIIEQNGKNYQVLTNWHVVSESEKPNDYTVKTIDGNTHSVTDIQRLDGVDLAIIAFSSRNSYSVAKLGDSGNLTEGQKIHF